MGFTYVMLAVDYFLCDADRSARPLTVYSVLLIEI